jgi:hypothetical protein
MAGRCREGSKTGYDGAARGRTQQEELTSLTSAELRYTVHWDDLTVVAESCSDQWRALVYHRENNAILYMAAGSCRRLRYPPYSSRSNGFSEVLMDTIRLSFLIIWVAQVRQWELIQESQSNRMRLNTRFLQGNLQ